jgi:hypothetical protein
MSDLEVRQASQLTPEAWEELIAGAFKKDGYDEAILTPRSGEREPLTQQTATRRFQGVAQVPQQL